MRERPGCYDVDRDGSCHLDAGVATSALALVARRRLGRRAVLALRAVLLGVRAGVVLGGLVAEVELLVGLAVDVLAGAVSAGAAVALAALRRRVGLGDRLRRLVGEDVHLAGGRQVPVD